jgi:hypothetical protein
MSVEENVEWFIREDGGDTFLRNVGSYKINTAPHPRRRHRSHDEYSEKTCPAATSSTTNPTDYLAKVFTEILCLWLESFRFLEMISFIIISTRVSANSDELVCWEAITGPALILTKSPDPLLDKPPLRPTHLQGLLDATLQHGLPTM